MAISKVTYAGNTLIDLTGDTVTPENLLSGATAHAANGEEITGIVEDKKGELEAQIEDLRNQIGSLNANLAKLYPVGSIYISVNDTDPGTFIGGTWERIKNRFLLAAGDAYAAGSTGGEAEHTLTEDEMPSHTHHPFVDEAIGAYKNSGGSGWKQAIVNKTSHKTSDEYYFGFTGGNQPHNNMPPYLGVYMWKRTA